ncbi:YdcF family protein [Lacipirellula limnantheis]
MLTCLEGYSKPLLSCPENCDTIVVLAGSILPKVPGEPLEQLGDSSLRRCLEAARLYKQNSRLTIIVSGGRESGSSHAVTLAQLMATFLAECGVKVVDIVQETESTNTLENSTETARLLEASGTDHIVLVTDAAHMRRAARCFERRGIRVTLASCNYQGAWPPESWRWIVPSPSGLLKTQYACHELLGAIWYWFIDSPQSMPDHAIATQ